MLIKSLTILALHLCLTKMATAQNGYCAFEVSVRSPEGAPLVGIPVALIQGHKTSYLEATTDSHGIARLCDAPVDPVDIVAGIDLCGSVAIRSVSFQWPQTQRLSLTYVQNWCDHLGIAPERQVILRVVDEQGRPLEGALFEGSPSGVRKSGASDALGRLFFIAKPREVLDGMVVKRGRESSHVYLVVVDNTELKIILKGAPEGR